MLVKQYFCGMFAFAGVCLVLNSHSHAAPLNLSTGSIVIDTDTLTISGAASATGVLNGGVAEFSFDSISLGSGVNVTLQGSNPLGLNSTGNIVIGTTLNASGGNGGPQGNGSPGGVGILGGFNGGAITQNGTGPGAGTFASGDCCGGGGGGAFGGNGGIGRSTNAGGTAYGDAMLSVLQGGSGGAGGGNCCSGDVTGSGGGAGGGAISLFSEFGTIEITSTGELLADGGSTIALRSGGGGAGGGLLLDAGQGVIIDGFVSAQGGDTTATDPSQNRGGGGGGGGRIVINAPELFIDGISQVDGALMEDLNFLTAAGGQIFWAGTGDPGTGGGGGSRSAGFAGTMMFAVQEARSVPEPASLAVWAMIGAALIVLGHRRRRVAA